MIKSLIKILIEGVEGDEAPLRDNGFARRLTAMLLKRPDESDIIERTRLLSVLFRSRMPVSSLGYEVDNGNDFRIKTLFLNNVRQYSINDEKAEYYSFDFADSDSESSLPISCVFQGANGSGKTSVFSSLEYLYLGKSSIAEAHGESDEEFLRSINRRKEDIAIRASLQSREVLENKISGNEIPAAFCSECDYFEITRYWKRIDDYFAFQMGYGELLRLLRLLRELNDLFQIVYQYKKKTDQKAHLISNRETFDRNSEEYRQQGLRISSLNNELVKLEDEFIRAGGYSYVDKIETLLEKIPTIVDLEVYTREISEFTKYVKFQWKGILQVLREISARIINTIVGESLEGKYETLELDLSDTDLTYKLNAKSKLNEMDSEEMSPIKYFNTFRLKLFCVALKMGLFCCAKVMHHINLPFVMDDIFDSSDFSNRSRIRRFIRKMFEAHDETLKRFLAEGNPDHSLQMIFFTQDNVIGENVFKGINDYSYENVDSRKDIVKYRRLFSPNHANPKNEDPLDYRDYYINGKLVRTIKVSDKH